MPDSPENGRVPGRPGIPAQAPGVLAGENAGQVLTATIGLLGQHRLWDRFPVRSMADSEQ